MPLCAAESKSIEVRVSVTSDATVLLDVRLARSALGNLGLNGVKYTKAHSAIDLRAGIVNNIAVIEIEDCCGGLSTAKMEQAFAPFSDSITARRALDWG
jgi:signal transduction histidine kinase